MPVTIAEFFRSGGNTMYLILIIQCFGLAVILERFFFLYYRYNINAPKLFQQIRLSLTKGDFKSAIGICDDTPLPAILKAGLERFRSRKEEVVSAMEDVALEVTPKIQKRTPYLAVAANIATLLGLLGTIFGLIIAFRAIHGAAPGEKALELARGISIAMYTTAYGLITAIPCLLFQAILQTKANRLLDEIDEYSVKTAHLLESLNRSGKEPS